MKNVIGLLKIENNGLRPRWLSEESVAIFIRDFRAIGNTGETFAYLIADDKVLPAITKKGKNFTFAFDIRQALEDILFERYFSHTRPLYTYLPGFARECIPRNARKYIKRAGAALERKTGDPILRFPAWPIDRSLELLKYIITETKPDDPFVRDTFSDARANPRFILTHDIDSHRGFDTIDRIRSMEEDYGVRSVWFIVGKAMEEQRAAIRALLDSGNEIGLHGISHDNKIAFLKKTAIEKRLLKARKWIADFHIRGFRSPSLFRTEQLLDALSGYFEYDSSVPDTGVFSPYVFPSGCCSVFPFFRKKLLEVPVTLPMDSALIFSGTRQEEIFDIWREKTRWIESVGGVGVLLTHAEPHFIGEKGMLKTYERFLKYLVRETAFRTITASEVIAEGARKGSPTSAKRTKEYV